MNKILFLALAVTSSNLLADEYVDGYARRDGTYVQPHMRSDADHNPYNNYSTQGNTNPYTGQEGTRDPGKVQQEYSYGSSGGFGNNSRHNRSRF